MFTSVETARVYPASRGPFDLPRSVGKTDLGRSKRALLAGKFVL